MKQISSHRAGGESGYSQYRSGPYEKCDRSTARAVRNNLRVKKLTGSAFSYNGLNERAVKILDHQVFLVVGCLALSAKPSNS